MEARASRVETTETTLRRVWRFGVVLLVDGFAVKKNRG
jgi:hypothetical protein